MELMIVVGLMGLISVLVIPSYGKYRQRMESGAAAQAIVSDLRILSSAAGRMEDYCVCVFADSSTYYTYEGISSFNANVPKKRRNLLVEYPRAKINPSNVKVVFGPKGWVDTSVGSSPSNLSSSVLGSYTVYNLYVHAYGLVTNKITIHQDGKMSIEQRQGDAEW